MYEERVGFQTPEDIDTPIWRYMDLPKFLSLIRESNLHFTQLDRFADAFEGAMPLGRAQALQAAVLQVATSNPEHAGKIDEIKNRLLKETYEKTRRNVYVNC